VVSFTTGFVLKYFSLSLRRIKKLLKKFEENWLGNFYQKMSRNFILNLDGAILTAIVMKIYMCFSVHLEPNLVNACLPKGYTFRSRAIEESETHALCSIQFSPRRMIFETLKNEGMSEYSNLEDTEQPTVVLIAYIHLPMCTQKQGLSS